MTPQEAIQKVEEVFPFDYYISADSKRYNNILKTVLRYLHPPAKILDFGAGPADKTAMLATLGFDCTACDDLQDDWHLFPGNREKILNFVHRFNIRYHVTNGNPLPFTPAEFDMVMMHDVLEHLHDSPRELINDLLELVKPEGLFFVTVPNAVNLRKRIAVLLGQTNMRPFDIYYWSPGPWRDHVREYVKDDLVKLAGYANLEILELRSCHHMLRKLPKVTVELFKALTVVFPGFRDSWLLMAKKKPGWEPVRSIPREEVNKMLYSNDPVLRGVVK